MKYICIIVVMLLSMTMSGQTLLPNQKVIKKTFNYFLIEGKSKKGEYKTMLYSYTVSFTHKSSIKYVYAGNTEEEEQLYSVVLDNRRNTSNFLNDYNLFTWYVEEGVVHLRQEVLSGEYKGLVLIFK
tara:strand:+ start:108 stop:488 length:381 start_codon:yes stop_codon:yes gene_type:complete